MLLHEGEIAVHCLANLHLVVHRLISGLCECHQEIWHATTRAKNKNMFQ